MKKTKNKTKKDNYEVVGYYYNGKTEPETILLKKDGSGKTKKVKGVL